MIYNPAPSFVWKTRFEKFIKCILLDPVINLRTLQEIVHNVVVYVGLENFMLLILSQFKPQKSYQVTNFLLV